MNPSISAIADVQALFTNNKENDNRNKVLVKHVERPFQGTAVLQYHASWDYFCQAMGLEIVGSLEPKPGIPPTPGHLRQVVEQARVRNAKRILVEPYYPKRPVRFVEEKAGVKALRLPLYLGGKKGIEDYLENLRYIVDTIVGELQKG